MEFFPYDGRDVRMMGEHAGHGAPRPAQGAGGGSVQMNVCEKFAQGIRLFQPQRG